MEKMKIEEWVLCAAIHFDDGKKREGQPDNIQSGFVIAGRRHHNCYATLQAIGEALGITEGIVKNLFERVGRDSQGFITNLDRYVDRKEGYRIAKAAGQIQFGGEATDVLINFDTPMKQSDPILISENLY